MKKKLLTIILLISCLVLLNGRAEARRIEPEIQFDSFEESNYLDLIFTTDIDFLTLRFSYTDYSYDIFNVNFDDYYVDINAGFNFDLAHNNRTRILAGTRIRENVWEEIEQEFIFYSDMEQYVTENIFINPSINGVIDFEEKEADNFRIKGLLGAHLNEEIVFKFGAANRRVGDNSELGFNISLQMKL